MTAPRLLDPTGRLRIGSATTPDTITWTVAGATSILYSRTGQVRGVYVDNETPGRDHVAAKLRTMIDGLVVVGLYPSEAGHKIPGCITALEWYCYPGYASLPLPRAEAFIVQSRYALPGCRPPFWWQRRRLLRRAWAAEPSAGIVWTY